MAHDNKIMGCLPPEDYGIAVAIILLSRTAAAFSTMTQYCAFLFHFSPNIPAHYLRQFCIFRHFLKRQFCF